MRVLGKPAGIFVLLMDAAKGFTRALFQGWCGSSRHITRNCFRTYGDLCLERNIF
jgi:glycerol-3-phosphate acyltransferase PlsY